MRHPTTHSFLKWAGSSVIVFCGGIIGLLAALAGNYPGIKKWSEDWFYLLYPIMTAPWFVAAMIFAICAYIWALVWTGQERKSARPGIYVTGEGVKHLKVEPASPGPFRMRFIPLAEIETDSEPWSPSRAWFKKGVEDSLEKQSLDRKARWEADRQKSITPQRDVILPEALAYAEFGEWGRSFFFAVATTGNRANEQLERFRQLAHDGCLSVWGKRSEGGVFQLIPKEHWLDHDVEWFDLLRGKGRSEKVTGSTPIPYSELMVCKAEFEREWPHA